jgi:hypothetical protein
MPTRVLLLAVAGTLVLAAPATAVTYCVLPDNSCAGAQTYPNVQTALAQAASTPAADKVLIGAGTYTAPTTAGFVYNGASALELAGKGATTVLTGPSASTQVLAHFGAPGSSLHHLRVLLPANVAAGAIGLSTTVDAAYLTVDESPTQGNSHTLMQLGNAADLTSATITSDPSSGLNSVGLSIADAGSTATDLVVSGRTAITDAANGGSIIDRVRATASASGIEVGAGTVVRNCLVSMPSDEASAAIAVYTTGASVTNCTLVGGGAGSATLGVYASGTFNPASVTIANTVMRSFGHARLANGAATSATIATSWSDFDAGTDVAVNGGTLPAGTGNGYHAAAGFFDEAGGDYQLHFDSPLVDAGDPATTGDLDVRRYTRLVQGRVDIGAFEYPHQGPEPEIDGPTDGAAGTLLSWTGSAQDPDGADETALLSYAWTIDGHAAIPGATLEHSFTYGGTYMLVLTVTDPAGAATTLEYPVVISGPAPPAPPPDPAPSGGGPAPGAGEPGPSDPGPSGTPGTPEITPATGCVARRIFTVRLDRRLRRATARLAGAPLKVRRSRGRLVVRVNLSARRAGTYRLKVTGRSAKGKRLRSSRAFKVCA